MRGLYFDQPFVDSRRTLFHDVAWATLTVWLLWLLWVSRRQMLDDALIHLRYAAVFAQQHRISYDGVHSNYGTSSLLYVLLLAALRSITTSPLLPKIVSFVSYAGLLAVLAAVARRSALGCAALLLFCGPFAVRWLSDGMETSLVCLLTAAFAVALVRQSSPLLLGLLTLALSALRVDLTLVVAFGSLILLLDRQYVRAVAAAAGSGISLLLIWRSMGRILPDTALAKTGLGVQEVLMSVVHVIVSTASFGVGVAALWLATAILAWRKSPGRIRRTIVAANLVFPVLVLLAAVKGQQMQAIRYLLWSLLFSLLWNLLILQREPSGDTSERNDRRPLWLPVFACILAVSWALELPRVLHIFRGRTATLDAMEQAHLERLSHIPGLAGDVGFIGYFTQSPICDLNGLVNGRERAALTYDERMQICMAEHPTYLFISGQQMGYLEYAAHLQRKTEWINCGSVDFPNTGSEDRHFLFVRRDLYPQGCPLRL